jgi:hypothetical protein
MKKIRMALTGVLFVLPMTAFSAQLDSSALRSKTFKAIDKVVSAESYPQKMHYQILHLFIQPQRISSNRPSS